ncbi:uncharacterized protein PHALS_14216 [Plasmopara halstedii]|uniref:Uncharacterized protein n=1 Tax=Plasmopara halstedii TaxID=4781 RepID=A0A0P1ARM0_PLAHL|nr:uncharacterized protein PHALS_14216 [Plasmopara halstedii]CEG43937.1 hypothetical protein PHALS_14216 [Plasmopara halstedii]|eukprot:XP_024580306.1 hypothetical protein PHALS_14216 [Plasmopara halstedii]
MDEVESERNINLERPLALEKWRALGAIKAFSGASFVTEDGLELDDERISKETRKSLPQKRSIIDEDVLLAEAVLAYAARIDGFSDIPNTYAEARASDEAVVWRAAMKTEQNGIWSIVSRRTARPIGY